MGSSELEMLVQWTKMGTISYWDVRIPGTHVHDTLIDAILQFCFLPVSDFDASG